MKWIRFRVCQVCTNVRSEENRSYLHLLDGVLSVSHIRHRDGGEGGVRAQAALDGWAPPMAWNKLQEERKGDIRNWYLK